MKIHNNYYSFQPFIFYEVAYKLSSEYVLYIVKGVISKFWNFLYYWSDLTEIFTQYVKLNEKHFLFLNIFPFRLSFLYIYKYIDIHIYIKKNRTPSVFMLE